MAEALANASSFHRAKSSGVAYGRGGNAAAWAGRYWPMVRISQPVSRMSSIRRSICSSVSPRPTMKPVFGQQGGILLPCSTAAPPGGPLIPGLGPDGALQLPHRLHIVVQHLRMGGNHHVQGIRVSLHIGNQRLTVVPGHAASDGPDAFGELLRPPSGRSSRVEQVSPWRRFSFLRPLPRSWAPPGPAAGAVRW